MTSRRSGLGNAGALGVLRAEALWRCGRGETRPGTHDQCGPGWLASDRIRALELNCRHGSTPAFTCPFFLRFRRANSRPEIEEPSAPRLPSVLAIRLLFA